MDVPTVSRICAQLYAAICIGVVVFQICLIAGAPWGRLTQGGAHPRQLPWPNRIGAGLSCVLMGGLAVAILSGAGIWPHWPFWTAWVALAVSVLSFVMNVMTPSQAERRLWAPVTFVMCGLAAVVCLAA